MRLRNHFLWLRLAWRLGLLLSLLGSAMATDITNFPRQLDQPHHNPHMGWLLIVNCYPTTYDRGRSLPAITDGTAWGEVDIISILSDWAAVEPQPGVYDWSLLDQEIEFWVSRGKTIKFRFSTDTMLTNGRLDPIGGAPDWLYDLGVPYITRTEWGLDYKVPDYSHPVYQQHLTQFLQAFADHFKQYPQIETIDLLAYGTWGEWHSGYDFATLAQRRQALSWLLDSWLNAFSAWPANTWFLLSNSYEWRNEMLPAGLSIMGSPAPSYEDYVSNSAFDYGFSRRHVGLGRYGMATHIKQGYDGRYIHEFFKRTRRPLYHEIAGTWQQFETGQIAGYDGQSAMDETLLFHPNYLTMLGWDIGATGQPLADVPVIQFYNQQSQGIMQYALKYMGYRLAVPRITLPDVLVPGQPFAVTTDWQNSANGRLYIPYRLRFDLVNGSETAWTGFDDAFDVTNLVRAEPQQQVSRFTLPLGLTPGHYDLRLSLADRVTSQPAITLDMPGADGRQRYLIGNVEVRPDGSSTTLPAVESFESGSFSGLAYAPPSGQAGVSLTQVTSETLAGAWSVKASLSSGTPETVILRSDPALLPLSAGATYRLTFRYRALQQDAANGAWFGFAVRSAAGGDAAEVGAFHWQDEAGAPATTKSVLFTLGAQSDYALTWTMNGGGVLLLDDLQLTRIPDAQRWFEGFSSGGFTGSLFTAGLAGGEILSASGWFGSHLAHGQVSYDHVNLTPHWYEFLASDPAKLALKRNTTYTVTFRSRHRSMDAAETQLLAPAPYGSYGYLFARSAAAGTSDDLTLLQWLDQKDAYPERKTVTFTTGNQDDYQLIWGLRNGGNLEVGEITLIELGPVSSLHPVPERLTAFADEFQAADLDATRWAYAEDGAGAYSQLNGTLTLAPAQSADWLSNVVTSLPTIGLNDEQVLRIKAEIASVQVSNGWLRVELGVRGGTSSAPYFFASDAALTCLLVTDGTQGYLLVNSKPAGQPYSNGTINLQGPVVMRPLTFPLQFELQVSRTGFNVLLDDQEMTSGTHTADLGYEATAALGCQNHAAGRGSVSFERVEVQQGTFSAVALASFSCE
jgi:hypothetical protein